MTEGVVTGGWGFVWAAYAITALALLVYGVMIVTNLRREETRAGEGEQR
jgi:heme exporter protein D